MATVGTVIIDVKADTAKLVSGMDRAEKSIKKTVGGIKTAIISMATAYVGIQGVRAFTHMINDSLDAADATGKLAQKLGLTTDALSEYQYAAGFAAVSNGELNAGLSALIRRLNNFERTGGGAAKKAFEELGISAEYARKHFTSTDIAFKEILKRLEKMPDGFKKTAIAQDIFSKSASGIMRITATDLKKFSEEAQKIGISISQSTYNMAAAYHDEMDQLDARLKGFKQTVAFSVVAPMNAASKTALEMVDNMFGSSSAEKMKNFENIAVTAITNVVYTIGFIKDAFTGVKLVITSVEHMFYTMAWGINKVFDTLITDKINDAINAYNKVADLIGKNKISNIVNQTTVDLTSKMIELSQEADVLTKSLANSKGRATADEFVKKFKENLAVVKEEAKKVKKEVNSDNGKDTVNNNRGVKKLQDELNAKQKAYSDYIQIVGTKEQKFQDNLAQKMKALGASGTLTAEQLKKAFKKLSTVKIDFSFADVKDSQSEMLQNQIDLISATNNWGTSLDGVAGKMQNLGKSISALAVKELTSQKQRVDLNAQYEAQSKKIMDGRDKELAKAGITEKQTLAVRSKAETAQYQLQQKHTLNAKALKQQQQMAEIAGYGQIAGAVSGLFQQGSSEAKAFMLVQEGLAVVNGVATILNASSKGGLPAVAAAIGVVANVLSMANIAFGGKGSTTTSYSDSFASQKDSVGKGTTFGDSAKQSESIDNSLKLISDYAKPQYRELQNINSNLSGLKSSINAFVISAVGNSDKLKGSFTPSSSTSGFTMAGGTGGFIGGGAIASGAAAYYGADLVGSLIGGGLGGIAGLGIEALSVGLKKAIGTNVLSSTIDTINGGINHAIDGAFSSKTTNTSLNDYGMKFNKQLVTEAIKGINGSRYQTIKTETKTKSALWGLGGTNTNNNYSTKILEANKASDELNQDLSNTFKSIYDTTVSSAKALGLKASDVVKDLSTHVIDTTKISLNKDGETVQKDFTSFISGVADSLSADSLNGLLDNYRKVGEGLNETETRIGAEVQVVTKTLGTLGISYTNITNAGMALAKQNIKVSDSLVNMSGGLKNFTTLSGDYYDSFFSKSEKLANTQKLVKESFDKLNLSVPTTNEAFKKLVTGLDLSTDSGRKTYVSLLQLASSFKVVGDAVQANLDAQVSNTLVMQKLKDKLATDEQNSINTSITAVKSLSDAFKTMESSISSTINTLLGTGSSGSGQIALLKQYWSNKSDLNTLFAKNGNLTNAEQSRMKELVKNIESLSTNIQKSTVGDNTGITNSLVSDLDNMKHTLDLQTNFLNVKVDAAQWSDMQSLNINGVEAKVIVGNDKTILTSLIDKDLSIKIGESYNNTIKSLLTAGYKWDGDSNLSNAQTLVNAGYTWNKDNELKNATSMISAGYAWNKDKNINNAQEMINASYAWDKNLGLSLQMKNAGYTWNKDNKFANAQTLVNAGYVWNKDEQLSNAETLVNAGYAWNKDKNINNAKSMIKAGYSWDKDKLIINSLKMLNAGYAWNKDKNLSNAETLYNAGYKWDGDGHLLTAEQMKNAHYLWNKEGLKQAVNTVSTVDKNGNKVLEFDWANDKVVDATAIIGKNGDLTKISKNTGTSSDTTVGVLSKLKTAIDTYNQNIESSLKVDTTPLALKDFRAGGLLDTVDEIKFRESFKADSASSFNSELEKLRTSLSYLSLSTTNTADYLGKLAKSDPTTFKNIGEFNKSIGASNNADYNLFLNAINDRWGSIKKDTKTYDELFSSGFGTEARNVLLDRDFYQKNYASYSQITDANKNNATNKYYNNYANDPNKSATDVVELGNKILANPLYQALIEDGSISSGDLMKISMPNRWGNRSQLYYDYITFLSKYLSSPTKEMIDNMENNITYSLQKSGYKHYDGSHKKGLDYVPFDGYIAELHQGERVMTKQENNTYNNSNMTPIVNKLDDLISLTQQQAREIQRLRKLEEDKVA